ncbi:MAG: response regulator [Candidatus Portnoybacteria bacterium]|nr:response regulator [Candidatus Portnoybacteria bacterium]
MSNQQKTIVLIEDEEVMSNLLIQKLKKAGYNVESALDGETGLRLINEKKPDLVLLDMLLPKLNGTQLIEELVEKKVLPDLPIIVISNSGQPVEIDQALKAGVRDYLIKLNFNPDEVLAKVSEVIKAEEEKPANKEKKPSPAKDQKPGHNILIVEDDMFMANLLERKFSQDGYLILRASNAGQAREVLSANIVDLILLDIVLPGMDGFTFLKELKGEDKFKNIPVIVASNLGQDNEIEKGMSEGATDYVVKANASPAEIVEKVRKILAQK